MKKTCLFCILICLLSALSACGVQKESAAGGSFTNVYGINLTVYDDNDEYIDDFSSVTASEGAKLSLNANKSYIIKVGLAQGGGSTPAFISDAAAIEWNYDDQAISIKKRNDVETDTSFFMECKIPNETVTLDVRFDNFSLSLELCFEN